MHAIIKFFLEKERLNYTIFVFLLLLGIVSYQSIPKDVYPVMKIDKIQVSGSYAGASPENLDKMAVINLEKDLKALSGVEKIETYVKAGSFSVIMTLEANSDKVSILNKTKDIISDNKSDLPQDMDEPRASIIDFSFPLINITISSNEKSKDELIQIADKIKTQVSSIENIAKVQLYQNTTRTFEIIIDNKKLQLYNLDKSELFTAIKQLSYIYPLGKIKDKKEHLFLSTNKGKKKVEEYLNTQIKINDKVIYLGDIARVEKKYKEVNIISKLNGSNNIDLSVSKNEKANAITLVKQLKEKIKSINKEYKDVDISTFADTSVYIKNRLNTVISGIMFGLILITFALYILINKRVAFIVVMGIPTSILLGVAILSLTSYSINMMTLIGTLLILGVLVDDAVIIAENIQRHITIGENKLEATIQGVKEVLLPVTASSITTLFAFLPMLMLTGEVGEFLKLIPIAIIILILASILESFVFLPIHSLHILNKNDKELDWTKAHNLYSKFLHKIIEYRKSFLLVFIILVPLVTVLIGTNMRYQFFPTFDSDKVYIRGKFEINNKLEDTYAKTKLLEKLLLENKKELALKTISYTVGLRTDNEENIEINEAVFEFNIELESRVSQNFVDAYITPILSFDDEVKNKTRIQSVDEIITALKKLLKTYKPEGLNEFAIKKEGAGVTANDIEILLNTKDDILLLEAIREIKKELNRLDGIVFVDDTAKFGARELKLEINSYGESLGFNENIVANILSPLFLKSEQAKGIDKNGIFELITYDENKDDFNTLKDLEINIPNTNKKIILSEIADFIYVKNFASITKVNRVNSKRIVANVNSNILTSGEALSMIDKTIQKYKNKGVNISFEGEVEQNNKMLKELAFSFFVSMFLIFITLLIMFNSFRQTIIILSIIPFSVLGALVGHVIMGLNLSLISIIGILGLAGVVINDAIVMLDFIRHSKNLEEMMQKAKLRLRPILITSITTFLGLSTLIFFATGQAKILQPIAISLGFGLIWGTVLTLVYLPALFAVSYKMRKE